MADPKRERALALLVSLRKLAEHPNTPPHEAEAARGRIAALRKKHQITEPPPKPGTGSTPPWWTTTNNPYTWNATNTSNSDAERRARARRMAEDDVRRQRERKEAAAKAATEEARRVGREKAQREYEARMRDKDANGQPLSDAEKREAQRDPLGWAARQDKRTHAQKQEDLNRSHGAQESFKKAGDEAKRTAQAFRDLDAKMRAQAKASSNWDTSTKYQAKITNVREQTSKAGNAMVVIEYTIGSTRIMGYYVLNQERGLKALMAVVSTLLGPAATEMSVDTILNTLHGQSCTVMLNSWTTDQGEEKWTVQTVMKPWA